MIEDRLRKRIRDLASSIFQRELTSWAEIYKKVYHKEALMQYPKNPTITEVQAHQMACNELIVEYQAKQAAALFNIQIQLTKIANNPSLYEKANESTESTRDAPHGAEF